MDYKLARKMYEPTDLAAANLAQRRTLLNGAAPHDLEDLVPILSAKVTDTKAAYDRASAELADCLLAIQERAGG